MKTKTLWLLFFAALLCLGLSACKSTPETLTANTLSLVTDGKCNYTIVRADTGKQTAANASILLKNVLRDTLGAEPTLATDWKDGETDAEISARLEILVGKTNRPESGTAISSLKAGQYVIRTEGNKIVICGYGESETAEGVRQFLLKYICGDTPAGVPVSLSETGTTSSGAFSSVADFGALGDGKHDDTEAFRSAITAAEESGNAVFVPAGTFRITGSLHMTAMTMLGQNSGSKNAGEQALYPTILHENHAEPLFILEQSSISGFRISVGYKAEEGEISETVRLFKTGPRVSDVIITNAYRAIWSDDTSNPGRCFLENVLVRDCFDTGIYVGGTYDVPAIKNCEVTTSSAAPKTKVAFRLGHNDDMRMTGLLADGAEVGFLITTSKTGSFWGSLTSCTAQNCTTGLQITGEKIEHHVTLNECSFSASDLAVVMDDGDGVSTLSAVSSVFRSTGANAVSVRSGQMCAINGYKIYAMGANAEAIRVSGCCAVSLT